MRKSRKCVDEIFEDLMGRSGIQNAFESVDDDILEEIKQTMQEIIEEEYENE